MRRLRLTQKGLAVVGIVIILVVLVASTLIIIQKRGEQARQQTASEVAQNEAEKATEVISTPQVDDQSELAQAAQSSAALPQSGPSASIVPVALLALAGTYYLKSRRLLR